QHFHADHPVFSCSKSEQKQLNTWVSFQSAEEPLLGQFSVSGNTQEPYRGVFFRLRYRFMAAVRGRPSGLPVALIAGFSPCAQLPPKPVRRFVAVPQIKELPLMCFYVYRTERRHPSVFISSLLGGAV
ncbi:hypothetical protein, partial [Pseudomonas lactis]|uniref:hypothetical protein n=1 Tax=Pseudomonas lactis TaxID=1615674 RepID=UPI001F3A46EA